MCGTSAKMERGQNEGSDIHEGGNPDQAEAVTGKIMEDVVRIST